MAATDQLEFLSRHFFSNFNIIFLATWGCASDFLKILPKFKIAARGQFQIFFVGAKTPKLKVGNYHIPHDMEMCK